MVEKKSKKANLENRKKSFLQLGLIVAISFTLVAFEWSTHEYIPVGYSSELSDELLPEIVNVFEFSKPKAPKPTSAPKVVKNTGEVVVTDEKLVLVKETKKKVFIEIDPSEFVEETKESEIVIETVKPTPPIQNAGNPMFDGMLPHYEDCEGLSSTEMFDCISDQINSRMSPNPSSIPSLEYTGPKKVTVFFVVDEKGKVSEVLIRGEEKFEKDLIKEVRRAVFNLPQMIPGSQGGEPIKARFTLPINFTIQ